MTGEQIDIDGDRALALLREVVAEHGRDKVYWRADAAPSLRECVYRRGCAPSCLVGHALHRAGLTVDELAEMDGFSDSGIRDLVADRNLPDRVRITHTAAVVFDYAQVKQDMGSSWGSALDTVDAELRDRQVAS